MRRAQDVVDISGAVASPRSLPLARRIYGCASLTRLERRASAMIQDGILASALALVISWLMRPVLRGLLYTGVSFSPTAFAAIAALLAIVALLAALQPALRATRADPMHALRAE